MSGRLYARGAGFASRPGSKKSRAGCERFTPAELVRRPTRTALSVQRSTSPQSCARARTYLRFFRSRLGLVRCLTCQIRRNTQLGGRSEAGTWVAAALHVNQQPSRRLHWLLWSGLAICLLAAVGWLAAPSLIARKVRKQLAALPGGYAGDIEGVELRLLSGEVAMLGMRIEKSHPHIPAPFLRADEFVIGFVREGSRLRNSLRVVRPVVSLVDGKTPAQDQWGPNFKLETLREQLPFELSELQVEDGQIHLRVFQAAPPVDAYISHLDVNWGELTNCLPPGTSACHSRVRVRGRVMGEGALAAAGGFERTPESRFSITGSVRDLVAKQLSPLLLRYAKVDVQDGKLDLDLRYRRHGDHYSALIVPKLDDFKVIGGDKDTKVGREMALALAAGWFERRRGEKAVRLQGTSGRDNLEFKVIDTPGRGKCADK